MTRPQITCGGKGLEGMIDRENAIRDLEQNIRWIEENETHQFPGWGNVTMAMRDAVELLKGEEPVKPLPLPDDEYKCPCCGMVIELLNPYCWYCGRKVKWDG